MRLVVILASLFLILYFLIQAWPLTWKVYKNDEFKFSFKYPPEWHLIFELPSTKAQVDKYGVSIFYIDSKDKLPNDPQDPVRSPGDVQVWIEKNSGSMDTHKLHAYYLKPKDVKYGDYTGYTSEGKGGLCSTSKTFWTGLYKNGCPLETLVLSKSFDLKSGNYYFYVNSLSNTDDMSLIGQLKTRFWGWVGAKIVDSFIFNK
jgi:hypothetical protein